MTDAQLIWAGFAVAIAAILIAAVALLWPHTAWGIRQRRRRTRRGGSIFQERP